MSHPDICVRGATTALTRRTTMRKAFLAPWHPLVEQFGLWFLAKAQQRTGVAVHSSHFVVNHHHTDVTPEDADGIPLFTRIFHGELSCALNTLLLHERYDAPGEIFDDRSTHRMRLMDAAAQASQLVYGLNNTTAAGLVARPEHMPGLSLSHHHWRSGPIVVERPPLYVDPRTNTTQLPLYVTPYPELYRAFDGDMDALIHHLDRLGEHGRTCIRKARRGRSPLSAKQVRRIHPWSEPKTRRETRGQRVPTYKVGARGLVGHQVDRLARKDTTRFRREHRAAFLARRDGNAEHVYPFGTYKARVHEGAPMKSQPLADAVVTLPGATLDDVKAELAELRKGASAPDGEKQTQRRHRLLDEVRGAFTEEAQEIVERDDLEVANSVQRAEPNSDPDAQPGPHGLEVQRLSGPRSQGSSTPSRIAVLRDRRRGRPRRRNTKHGSDPPV